MCDLTPERARRNLTAFGKRPDFTLNGERVTHEDIARWESIRDRAAAHRPEGKA